LGDYVEKIGDRGNLVNSITIHLLYSLGSRRIVAITDRYISFNSLARSKAANLLWESSFP
jgi:hypothetical protein